MNNFYSFIVSPDTDVAVGSLTCYGALLSLSSPHCEVEAWLKGGASEGWPWIVHHCATLVQSTCEYCIY